MNNAAQQNYQAGFIAKKQIQKEMYAALSEMYSKEAPLYKLLLAVNRHVNALVAKEKPELGLSNEVLDNVSSERHGAIRIASPEEFASMTRFFAVCGMQPHNAYMMTDAGAKSQPITGTGFRDKQNPSQRMFCSTLMLNYFDVDTQTKIKEAIKDRNIFSPALLALMQKSKTQGGLNRADVDIFIKEAQNLFKWSGKGHHYKLYQELKEKGLGVAADIVCFPNPHLNHLTPSSLDIDRLMDKMKEILSCNDINKYPAEIRELIKNVPESELQAFINNKGMKDSIEGPATPNEGKALVYLRQVSYNALPEKAVFIDAQGVEINTTHTARFGEIEQRGVAMTKKGRKIYDQCLDAAQNNIDPKLVKTDYEEYKKQYAQCFKPLDKTHEDLRKEALAYYSYEAIVHNADILKSDTADKEKLMNFLIEKKYIKAVPIRYDDFLPVSAAGIFAANLDKDAKKMDNKGRPKDTKEGFEKVTGVKIIDSDLGYAAMQAQTTLIALKELGLQLAEAEMKLLNDDINAYNEV